MKFKQTTIWPISPQELKITLVTIFKFFQQIRHILSQTRIGVQKKFPDSADLSERVIANFLFLRYISAAFTTPVVYDLAPATPTIVGQKVLLQVAKSLQHAANGNFSKLNSK